MNENKTAQIKSIVSKIDTNKIASYPQHPESKTLRQIIRFSKRISESSDEQEIFRLTVRIAYGLEMIVNKTCYVKDEEEKKY
jgi:hypothetical protein